MDDDDGGLFNIEVSSEDEAKKEPEKVPRDFQSEEDFQRQRAEWKPKIEVGEVRMNLISILRRPFSGREMLREATVMEDLEAANR